MDKMPAYRWRDAMHLASFLRNIGPAVVKELEPKMAAVLKDGEELPDVAHLLDVLGRMVVAAQANLDQKDHEKARHATLAASVRFDLRRDAMPELRSRVQEVRKWMKSHMHPAKLKILIPFKGRTPRGDDDLKELATIMVRRLANEAPIETPAGPVDPAGWADYLREPLEKVSSLLAAIDLHLGRESVGVKRKAKAMRTFDILFRRVGRVGWIFCHLGGIEKMARKQVYKGGRPGERIKKRKGPVNVA